MNYVKIDWLHDLDEPIEMYYEIDESRNVRRIIEIFKNGKANAKYIEEGEPIEEIEMPTISHINDDSQFLAKDIEASEFLQLWTKYRA